VSGALLCRRASCTWSSLSFTTLRGVHTSPKIGQSILVGESMSVECAQGYQLAQEQVPDLPGFVLEGLEALGDVKVLAFKSFPPPPPGEAVSYGLTGAFSDITLDLPAGAWPADLMVGPSLAIFEMPAAARRAGALAGLGLNLGPDGTSLGLPATITTPVDSSLDLGNRQLRVHRYNPANDTAGASWTPMPYPDGYQVPPAPSVLKATTSSFSAYFSLAVDPGAPPPLAPGEPLVDETMSAGFNASSNSTTLDASDSILGLERNLFIALVAGVGSLLMCLAVVCCLDRRMRREGKGSICKAAGPPSIFG
jgi:hypothetical protein